MNLEIKSTGWYRMSRERMAGAVWGFCVGCLVYLYMLVGTVIEPQDISTTYIIQLALAHKKELTLILVLCTLSGLLLAPVQKHITDWLFRFRYPLALLLFVLLVAAKISGSSIGAWYHVIGAGDSHVLAGMPKLARSDEWGTLTPLILGQEQNIFGAYSRYAPGINGITVDNLIVYGQPAWDMLMVFRPFYWGFLFWGSGYGLAWYWWGRMIALVMSYFELGMLLTNKNKKLSVLLSVCISFSPFLQWWFAVNGLAEMLIFGACILLGTHYLLSVKYTWKKYAVAAGMAMCAGGYIMTFYPAWMSPLAYGFLPIFVWIVIKKRNQSLLCKKDILPWVLFVALFGAGMIYMCVTSMDTIQAVLNSVYPGAATGRGEDGRRGILKYPLALFSWIYTGSHMVENTSFISFAPIGLILSIRVMVKEKKADLLIVLFLAMEILLTYYYCMGLPEWLSGLLLLQYTNGRRGVQMIEVLRLLLLVRALSKTKKGMRPAFAASMAIAASLFAVGMSWWYAEYDVVGQLFPYWGELWKIVAAVLLFTGAFYLLLRCSREKCMAAVGAACGVVILSSMWINPIQRGTEVVTENPLYLEIQKRAEEEPDKGWAVVDAYYPATNLPQMAGALCFNTTQTYPDPDRWRLFDSDGNQEDIYNRYCHIEAHLGSETDLTLEAPDRVSVILDKFSLEEMGIKYILTTNGTLGEDAEMLDIKLQQIYQYGGMYIFVIGT